MVFHWSLSDSKSLQVSRTRLRILTVLSILIVSIRPPTSKSSKPFNNPLVIVPKAPITIGTIVTFMFHSFFNSLARSRYLFFLSHPFRFILLLSLSLLSLLFNFQIFLFCFLQPFTKDLGWGKVVVICSLCVCFFVASFGRYYDHYYYIPSDFLIPWLTDGFSLEFEWQKVTRTLFCIQADFNNVVIRTVSVSSHFQSLFFPSFWGPFQEHQLISPSVSCYKTICTILWGWFS